jgi:hypothetical protein
MTPSVAAVIMKLKSGAREIELTGTLCSVFKTYSNGYPGAQDQQRISSPPTLKSSFVDNAMAREVTGSS